MLNEASGDPLTIPYDSLSTFVQEIFGPLPRVDQRRWAEAYVRGLVLLTGKKSLRRIAEEILSLPATQSLQQFLNQSPWDWDPVRMLLAHYVTRQRPSRVLVMNRVFIPKRGGHSVGVGRRYVPQEERVINCQVGLGAFLLGDDLSVPVNWRIVLSGQRLAEPERSVPVPADAVLPDEGAYMIDMLEQMTADWGLVLPPVVADLRGATLAEARSAERLIDDLERRDLGFMVETDGMAEVCRPGTGQGNVPTRAADRLLNGTVQRHDVLLSATRRLQLRSTVVHNGPRARRLIGMWSPARKRVTRFWVTNLLDMRVEEAISLGRLRERVRADVRDLEGNFGLRDFEGRSYRGWHHHMTLVSAAFVFHHLGWQDSLWPDPGERELDLPLQRTHE